MSIRRTGWLLLLSLTVSGLGLAAPAAPENKANAPTMAPSHKDYPVPPIIQRLRGQGLTVTEAGSFGRYLLLWGVSDPARPNAHGIVLTTLDGLMIQGKVFHSEDGSLLIDTQGHPAILLNREDRVKKGSPLFRGTPPRSQATPVPDTASVPPASPAGSPPWDSLWDQLGQATVIEEGRAGAPLVYIFFDPFCRYCHQQWTLLRDKVRQGQLRVRWAPVAVLDASLRQRDVVMGLLSHPEAAVLTEWMERHRASPDRSTEAKTALARNLVLFNALQVKSVPAMIYKDGQGALVRRAGIAPL
ncbi:MAG: thioredoxin fold domain-containing protein [Gammaproteobacteria bacterium]|nr:thioredoxin fold domain-containing protein [Gammaproteobacteria bacterium]MCP5458743.1 thioredoxin fold domain-containing protein [Gammaproteobacteria bacterium]